MSTAATTLHNFADTDGQRDTTPIVDTPETAGTQAPQNAPIQAEAEATETKPNNGNAFAITSFILGIASIVSSWTFVAPIVGLILGVLALRRDTQERTLALWGVWMNVAMLALTALAVVAFIAFVGFAAVATAIGS